MSKLFGEFHANNLVGTFVYFQMLRSIDGQHLVGLNVVSVAIEIEIQLKFASIIGLCAVLSLRLLRCFRRRRFGAFLRLNFDAIAFSGQAENRTT